MLAWRTVETHAQYHPVLMSNVLTSRVLDNGFVFVMSVFVKVFVFAYDMCDCDDMCD